MTKQFRHAYVVQNTGHDFSALMEMADSIIFLSTGYEPEDKLQAQIETVLADFVPDADVFVPVGNVYANFVAGIAIRAQLYPVWSTIIMARYREQAYHFVEVSL